MSEHLTRLKELAAKFAVQQSLGAPDIQWLISHLEKCYQDNRDASEEIKFTVHEVILHLNKRVKTDYRTDSIKTLRLVRGRYNEGYRLEDFIKVIDTKVREWKNNEEMAKYLRPSTLFCRGHFEEYLQQCKMDGPQETQFSNRPSI